MLNFSLHRPQTCNQNQLFNWISIRTEFWLTLILLVAVSHVLAGDTSLRVFIVLLGSIFSIAILHSLSKGLRARVLTRTLCYVPYLLGLYIFFVEGFWRTTQFLRNNSLWQVGLALFCFIVGSSLASTGYAAITKAKRLREGH